MTEHNIVFKEDGEKSFSFYPQEIFCKSNSYLRPFKVYVNFDEEVEEYQYSIKDLVSEEILTTGWFAAQTLLEAKKYALGQMANFIQNQAQCLNDILSDIIDFRYDIINNKMEE